ncbi:PadR family transcriptional regulator [Cryobacterium sp. Hb1]|uniref:PadR family transcriptional regulator n=1 Tax=Cryobacterium sp. Hb1 TaxID=1259147 RepID=UPI00106ADA5B|nr:PadR family transcriptional regulator [Cryobacterium sp. Hb1]TFD65571.1 PadR family transcriptional regulator [Cryobacterium sp. Hb1]
MNRITPRPLRGAEGSGWPARGTVSPLLNRLHDAGFVTSYWEANDTDRPRRYYQLTEVGHQELESFQEDWEQFSASVTSLLATIPKKHNDRTRDDA